MARTERERAWLTARLQKAITVTRTGILQPVSGILTAFDDDTLHIGGAILIYRHGISMIAGDE
jgi:hypothetical protein